LTSKKGASISSFAENYGWPPFSSGQPFGAGKKFAELGADTPFENVQEFYEEGLRTPSESFRGTAHRNQEEGD